MRETPRSREAVPHSTEPALEETAAPPMSERTWMYLHGFSAGVLGAAVVSIFFFLIDRAAGHALYTPNALGAALFRGETLGPDAPIEMVLVLGYTAAHGAVFWAFGVIAAVVLWERVRFLRSPWGAAAIIAVLLFAGFEITLLLFGALTPAHGLLGSGRAALANALAALGMAGYLAAARAFSSVSLPES